MFQYQVMAMLLIAMCIVNSLEDDGEDEEE